MIQQQNRETTTLAAATQTNVSETVHKGDWDVSASAP